MTERERTFDIAENSETELQTAENRVDDLESEVSNSPDARAERVADTLAYSKEQVKQLQVIQEDAEVRNKLSATYTSLRDQVRNAENDGDKEQAQRNYDSWVEQNVAPLVVNGMSEKEALMMINQDALRENMIQPNASPGREQYDVWFANKENRQALAQRLDLMGYDVSAAMMSGEDTSGIMTQVAVMQEDLMAVNTGIDGNSVGAFHARRNDIPAAGFADAAYEFRTNEALMAVLNGVSADPEQFEKSETYLKKNLTANLAAYNWTEESAPAFVRSYPNSGPGINNGVVPVGRSGNETVSSMAQQRFSPEQQARLLEVWKEHKNDHPAYNKGTVPSVARHLFGSKKSAANDSNNPGNLKPGGSFSDRLAIGQFQLGSGNGPHLVFATAEDGWKAFENDIEIKFIGQSRHNARLMEPTSSWVARGATQYGGRRYQSEPGSLLRYLEIYAPDGHGGNNSLKYAQGVARQLGVSEQTPVSQLTGQIPQIAQIMARREGYYGTRGDSGATNWAYIDAYLTEIGQNPLNQLVT